MHYLPQLITAQKGTYKGFPYISEIERLTCACSRARPISTLEYKPQIYPYESLMAFADKIEIKSAYGDESIHYTK